MYKVDRNLMYICVYIIIHGECERGEDGEGGKQRERERERDT